MNLDQSPPQKYTCEMFDSPLRWWVKSRGTSGSTYLVDLKTDEFPDGECQCKHFLMTVGPAQKRGEHKTCYHIELAKWAFAEWAINREYKADQNKE